MSDLKLENCSIKKLAELIRTKEISPVEVTEYYLDRIHKYNSKLNAVVFLDEEGARKAAKEAEAAVLNHQELGPMHGIPTMAKDIGPACPDWPCTYGGVRFLKDFKMPRYSHYMKTMIAAGAIPMGRTNSPTFAFCGYTDNKLFGPTANPFNTEYNSGGSSGGSASAVAAGLVPIAEGTDAGGSIRIPAAMCGIFGFKASFGTIPAVFRPNGWGATNPYVVMGPMAQSVEDTIEGLKIVAGFDRKDPYFIEQKIDFDQAFTRQVKGKKIGFTYDFGIFPVEPEIKEAVRSAAAVFEDLGAIVEDVTFNFPMDCEEMADLWCRIVNTTTMANLTNFKKQGIDLLKDHADDLPDDLKEWLARGYNTTLDMFLNDLMERTAVYDEMEDKMSKYDLLLSPVAGCYPSKNVEGGKTRGPASVCGVKTNTLIGSCLTMMTSLTGHVTASVPAQLSRDGFPIALQVSGQRHGDIDVLAACLEYEKARPWKGELEAMREKL